MQSVTSEELEGALAHVEDEQTARRRLRLVRNRERGAHDEQRRRAVRRLVEREGEQRAGHLILLQLEAR